MIPIVSPFAAFTPCVLSTFVLRTQPLFKSNNLNSLEVYLVLNSCAASTLLQRLCFLRDNFSKPQNCFQNLRKVTLAPPHTGNNWVLKAFSHCFGQRNALENDHSRFSALSYLHCTEAMRVDQRSKQNAGIPSQ